MVQCVIGFLFMERFSAVANSRMRNSDRNYRRAICIGFREMSVGKRSRNLFEYKISYDEWSERQRALGEFLRISDEPNIVMHYCAQFYNAVVSESATDCTSRFFSTGLVRPQCWVFAMPLYYFRIQNGHYSGACDHGTELGDCDVAWKELTSICGEIKGSISLHLKQNAEWQIELLDETKKPMSRIRLVAESFDWVEITSSYARHR